MVIYTRQSICAPIRAEEGLTGILCPPNSSTSFFDLPEDRQIGGYPTSIQLSKSAIDASTIDSEGRCVILEFPAFVLLGVYSPANRDESRDDFRLGFLTILDARIRNLISIGKRVILAGDLNISREELDTANAESSMRKAGLTSPEYLSTPSRRLFNQLIEHGKVIGERDEGREKPVLWDVCRELHPNRKGMFTCWEQKINARPGNCGSRIDYVLSSLAMKDWFSDSNIQEGLMVEIKFRQWCIFQLILSQGSDHCPVYAKFCKNVMIDGTESNILDVVNPSGMFLNGNRCRDYSAKDVLPLSGRLIPEFDGRRSIRQMFTRGSSILPPQSAEMPGIKTSFGSSQEASEQFPRASNSATQNVDFAEGVAESLSPETKKRTVSGEPRGKTIKQVKYNSVSIPDLTESRGQQSLKGFFKPRATFIKESRASPQPSCHDNLGKDGSGPGVQPSAKRTKTGKTPETPFQMIGSGTQPQAESLLLIRQSDCRNPELDDTSFSGNSEPIEEDGIAVHDPVASKDSWSRLFTKPVAPRCEGHNEPCTTLLTKKSGMNFGRSFWMCPRPLGPTGQKEKNTQWRCQTFIWCSDWNPNPTHHSASGTSLHEKSKSVA